MLTAAQNIPVHGLKLASATMFNTRNTGFGFVLYQLTL